MNNAGVCRRTLGLLLRSSLIGIVGATLAQAASFNSAVTTGMAGLVEPQRLSVLLETMTVMTVMAFVPSVLIMTTCFLRMIIVLGFLRHAMGTQQTPPNHILISLALILTFFVMAPTWERVNKEALQPYQQHQISWTKALDRASKPVSAFLFRQTRKDDLALAVQLSRQPVPKQPEDVSFPVLVTAFVLSELKTAFEIGFILFIPFLIIDLIVASVLMSLGMMMVPPTTISLPLKLLLFVMVNGWTLLMQGLVQSIR